MRLIQTPFLLTFLVASCTFYTTRGQSGTKRLRGANDTEESKALVVTNPSRRLLGTVTCRVTIESTSMADGTDQDVTMCIPVKNGREIDHLLPITLPESLASENLAEIHQGRLVVQLTDAKLSKKGITTSETTIFTVLRSEEAALYYEDLDEHRRVLGERSLATTGSLTIAVVRISAAGAPNRYTKAQLLSAWTGNGVSFKTQMNACSIGALTWTLGGYYNIVLPNTIASYGGRSGMQTAVEAQLRNIVNKDLKLVASKIAFCYPKGSGDWVASASFNWWRAQFNDLWALSLSAEMHEIGHTISLMHSSRGSEEYGDTSGMLGYSDPPQGAPRKCFNGHKNWVMGWYAGRRESVTGNKKIRLAAFTDYSKATASEPVVVQVDGRVYLQYNRQKTFNSETDLHVNKVSVTGVLSDGRSDSLAGLGVGESYTNGGTVIKVCSAVSGGTNAADVMIVAIGGNCNVK